MVHAPDITAREDAVTHLELLAGEVAAWCASTHMPLPLRVEADARPFPTLVVRTRDRWVNVSIERRHYWYASRDWILGEVADSAVVAAKLGRLAAGGGVWR